MKGQHTRDRARLPCPFRALAVAGILVFSLAATAGDAVKGGQVFSVCRGCHEAAPNGVHRFGPNLWEVVGKPVASAPGFDYSPALRNLGGVWDMGRLDHFITAPAVVAPGTRMTFPGLNDADLRADLLAYLASLGKGSVTSDEPTDWQGLPEGEGRRDLFYSCQACHSLKLVQQQRLSRRVWAELLAWMVTEKRMPEPSPDVKERLLAYLSTHYGAQKSATPGGLLPLALPLLP
ncbi:MAG: cytochrome c family protein [Pseudomonadota bacterium]